MCVGGGDSIGACQSRKGSSGGSIGIIPFIGDGGCSSSRCCQRGAVAVAIAGRRCRLGGARRYCIGLGDGYAGTRRTSVRVGGGDRIGSCQSRKGSSGGGIGIIPFIGNGGGTSSRCCQRCAVAVTVTGGRSRLGGARCYCIGLGDSYAGCGAASVCVGSSYGISTC